MKRETKRNWLGCGMVTQRLSLSDRCYTRESMTVQGMLNKKPLLCVGDWLLNICQLITPASLLNCFKQQHLRLTVFLCRVAPLKVINLCLSTSDFTHLRVFSIKLSLPVSPLLWTDLRATLLPWLPLSVHANAACGSVRSVSPNILCLGSFILLMHPTIDS